jgi:hypothetical protein
MTEENKESLRDFIVKNRVLFYPLISLWRLIRLPYRLLLRVGLKLNALERLVSEDDILIVQEEPYTSGAKAGDGDDEYNVEFRRVFAGRDIVRERQSRYLKYIEETYEPSNGRDGYFLDISTGRGDFLNLLKNIGIEGRGLESNKVFYERVRADGFKVADTDPNAYLAEQDDSSILGISAFHFTEHYEPTYIHSFLALAYKKIAPGGIIILECPNPKSSVSACNFYFDLTHVWPYPPEILKFMVEWAGFNGIKTVYSCLTSAKFKVVGAEECNYEDYAIIAWKNRKA